MSNVCYGSGGGSGSLLPYIITSSIHSSPLAPLQDSLLTGVFLSLWKGLLTCYTYHRSSANGNQSPDMATAGLLSQLVPACYLPKHSSLRCHVFLIALHLCLTWSYLFICVHSHCLSSPARTEAPEDGDCPLLTLRSGSLDHGGPAGVPRCALIKGVGLFDD